MAAPLDLGEQVVVFIAAVLRCRPEHRPFVLRASLWDRDLAVPPGVEASLALVDLRVDLVVDVVIEADDRQIGLVFQGDSGAVPERHGPITV